MEFHGGILHGFSSGVGGVYSSKYGFKFFDLD